eukprot:s3390_g5.t2
MLSSGRLGVLLLSQVEAALLMPLAWTLDLVEAALLMPLAWTLDLVTSVYAAAFLLSSFFVPGLCRSLMHVLHRLLPGT